MSKHFITPLASKIFDTIDTNIFHLHDEADTHVMITFLPPGTAVPIHNHEEPQIGMCLSGSIIMDVGGQTHQLNALETCYWVPCFTPHGGRNESNEMAVALDIKRRPQTTDMQLTHCPLSQIFVPRSQKTTTKNGIDIWFFVGPWFEIMFSKLAPGAIMPRHAHHGMQIGLGLSGMYTMEVGAEKQNFGKHDVYFADDHVPYGGVNHTKDIATSLNIFLPPRWNLLSQEEKSMEV